MSSTPSLAARVILVAAALAIASATGCINLKLDPKVNVSSSRAQAEPADPNMQYTPYAYELRQVLDQQATIESELRKRDWEELGDELGDWNSQVRRLNGVADTTDDPALMRRSCDELMNHIRVMRRGQRARDTGTVQDALDGAAGVLDRLSSEFPLVRPKDEAAATRS